MGLNDNTYVFALDGHRKKNECRTIAESRTIILPSAYKNGHVMIFAAPPVWLTPITRYIISNNYYTFTGLFTNYSSRILDNLLKIRLLTLFKLCNIK